MKFIAVFLLAIVAMAQSLETLEQDEMELDLLTQEVDLEQDERALEELEELEEEDEVEERGLEERTKQPKATHSKTKIDPHCRNDQKCEIDYYGKKSCRTIKRCADCWKIVDCVYKTINYRQVKSCNTDIQCDTLPRPAGPSSGKADDLCRTTQKCHVDYYGKKTCENVRECTPCQFREECKFQGSGYKKIVVCHRKTSCDEFKNRAGSSITRAGDLCRTVKACRNIYGRYRCSNVKQCVPCRYRRTCGYNGKTFVCTYKKECEEPRHHRRGLDQEEELDLEQDERDVELDEELFEDEVEIDQEMDLEE